MYGRGLIMTYIIIAYFYSNYQNKNTKCFTTSVRNKHLEYKQLDGSIAACCRHQDNKYFYYNDEIKR